MGVLVGDLTDEFTFLVLGNTFDGYRLWLGTEITDSLSFFCSTGSTFQYYAM